MPTGANSSFITLIPKVTNPIHVNEYWPISLIGIRYKIIAKVLANKLSKVINNIVSPEQTTCIASRQILDGPLILSEVIDWYKKRKKKMLLFKIDFEKAFDSVSWRYLDFMLCNLGFGITWRTWIKACLGSSHTSILVNGSPTSEFNVRRGLRQEDLFSHDVENIIRIFRIVGTSNYLHTSSILPIDSIRYQVGCGSTIRFWKDTWLGSSPLQFRYNRLFQLDHNEDCLILDRISNGLWEWNWSRDALGSRNTMYFNHLLTEISNIEVREGMDKRIWAVS
ncbi:RNA-directed DNA polymerase, eukaryota, reverse transcriptase zinc-binding domain protein [Tanacetum coccineum]